MDTDRTQFQRWTNNLGKVLSNTTKPGRILNFVSSYIKRTSPGFLWTKPNHAGRAQTFCKRPQEWEHPRLVAVAHLCFQSCAPKTTTGVSPWPSTLPPAGVRVSRYLFLQRIPAEGQSADSSSRCHTSHTQTSNSKSFNVLPFLTVQAITR